VSDAIAPEVSVAIFQFPDVKLYDPMLAVAVHENTEGMRSLITIPPILYIDVFWMVIV
jgi:hypothetical protein